MPSGNSREEWARQARGIRAQESRQIRGGIRGNITRVPRADRAPRADQRGNLTSPDQGGVAGRVWIGTPGLSDLIAGKLTLQEPVDPPDRELVEEELKGRLLVELARGIHARTGLTWSYPYLVGRVEWLVILEPNQDGGTRLQAFCEGWSALLPPGVRASGLTSMQVQELGRRLLGRMPKRGPDTEPGSP